MSSEKEATCFVPVEENPCEQVKAELEKFQEEIVRKLNQSKKELYAIEKLTLGQAEKIKEVDASIAASSKTLEQETYERWKFTQNLTGVRNVCQELNTYFEKIDDVLNRCELDILTYEKEAEALETILEKRKSIIDDQLEAERRNLNQLEAHFKRDKATCEKQQEDLIKKIAECKGKFQTEIETSLQLQSELDESLKRKDEVEAQNNARIAEHDALQNRLLEQQERKQHLLAEIENNRQSYNARTSEMKSILEEKKQKLQEITNENEIIEKELEEQINTKENILLEISEYSKQLDYYKQKCSDIEAEEKQMQELFAQECDKDTKKAQDLTDSLAAAEQKLSNEKEIASQLQTEVADLIEELERGRADIEILKSEIANLQSLNEMKLEEVSEKKTFFDNVTSSIIKMSNDLLDVTKKLNEKEIEKSQAVIKITAEINELEKQIENIKVEEEAKLKTLNEEMESLTAEARDNSLKQEERAKEINKTLVLVEQLKTEYESIVNNTKQVTHDLQGVTLEYDILSKKVEELEKNKNSLMMKVKSAPVFHKPRAQNKRDVDEMSDSSSMEGIISVQEHLKRQKLRGHKSSVN